MAHTTRVKQKRVRIVEQVTLTLNDRCDSCQAPAASLIRLSNGLKLLMCMHHTNQHKTALEDDGAVIIICKNGEQDNGQ